MDALSIFFDTRSSDDLFEVSTPSHADNEPTLIPTDEDRGSSFTVRRLTSALPPPFNHRMPHHTSNNSSKGGAGVGCKRRLELLEERAEARRARPQPWLLRKFMVAVVLALVAFSAYVYVGRLVVPGLRGNAHAIGRAAAIGLLVGYAILLAMFLWSYAMVVGTSPGYAIDHVQKTPAPTAPPQPQAWHTDSVRSNAPPPPSQQPQPPRRPSNGYTAPRPERKAPVLHPELQRTPPAHPLLRPEYRYCYREGILKPKRAHHCRACGKVMLQYDHHCPWIGQCVGARNARFFYIFIEWCLFYTLYVFLSLLLVTLRRSGGADIDPTFIAIMALSALFLFFSIGMLSTHTRLIILNQTTVESMSTHQLRERESHVLAENLSCCDARSRRIIKHRWDEEWGNPNTEGNIWWLGSARANWEQRMGPSVLGWFLPIGRYGPDGLDYAINPRFDADGRWRRREEWPAHLR
ncbi:zf-DHHC-domain-containing protein [Auricularia subglabra TFB-10046 SS5]|nr:zf-DHHC-domain-containing protein [Auricularia subglabra TFB-10046 SS5]